MFKNGDATAVQICSILGFSGYKFHNVTQIPKIKVHPHVEHSAPKPSPSILPEHPQVMSHISVWRRDVSATLAIARDEHPESAFEEIVGNIQSCFAYYIECVPSPTQGIDPALVVPVADKPSSSPADKPEPALEPIIQPHETPSVVVEYNATHSGDTPVILVTEEQHWPWGASVYTNGRLVCVGVVIDRFWVLTEKGCMDLVRLEFDYVVVVVGGSKPYLHVHSPYEQVIRVNCLVKLQDESSTVMLYLERSARYNRQCLPTFLPDL